MGRPSSGPASSRGQGVRSMAQPYTPSHQEYFPDAKGNKVKIPGGLMLYRCDVTFFKSDLAFKLGIHPDDPGAFHLHANDGGQLEQYAKELCAEVWDDEKQGWENPANKPNISGTARSCSVRSRSS